MNARQERRSHTAIRILVVDDSIVARAVLARSLQAEADIVVVAEAGSGGAALAAAAEHVPDVVLLDLEMPGMGGLEAMPALIAGGARVMVVSSACGDGAAASVRALALGAADTLLKPTAGQLAGSFARDLVYKIRRIVAEPSPAGSRPVVPQQASRPESVASGTRDEPVGCIAIGASTGGVHALSAFFGVLAGKPAAPILVTQHLPAPFMPYFASQLQEMSGRPAKLAVDGMPLRAGTIVLAPGDAHLGLARTRGTVHVRLERGPMPSGCTPSVDPMLGAVARLFGPAGLGVVLSGMGRDGAIGAAELAAAGGDVIVQDSESSVVWGMPGVVAASGNARLVLPPQALAAEVARRCEPVRQPAWT